MVTYIFSLSLGVANTTFFKMNVDQFLWQKNKLLSQTWSHLILVMASRILHAWNILEHYRLKVCAFIETYIKLFISFGTLNLVLYFTLCFLSIFVLSWILLQAFQIKTFLETQKFRESCVSCIFKVFTPLNKYGDPPFLFQKVSSLK